MSKKRRIKRLVLRGSSDKKRKTFFKKYISLISISIGSIIGVIVWVLAFKCKNDHCINSYYPVPYMGISAIVCWVIGVAFFKE